MSAGFNSPPTEPPSGLWMMAVFRTLMGLTESGTTADRPTNGLFVGRLYFDTSLGAKGKPIWRNKNNDGWVDATGADV